VDPTSGRILIDGRDHFEIPLTRLRRAIGFVPQETFLFSGTVAENIGLSLEILEPEPIARAASMAALDDELAAWPDGMQTVIGERGVTLSGGQKQRVALARALASDPRILVLDDCLSAVDPSTERRILESLAGARRGRTTILISHRLATVADADMILVLEDGEVQALGRHAELLAANGWYARTFREQEAGRS
jgi:ATP-binding cassette subfamily B protein